MDNKNGNKQKIIIIETLFLIVFVFSLFLLRTPAVSADQVNISAIVPGAYCGNDVVDAGESCDGVDLANQTCFKRGYTTGTLACNSDCTFNTSGCSITSGSGGGGGGGGGGGSPIIQALPNVTIAVQNKTDTVVKPVPNKIIGVDISSVAYRNWSRDEVRGADVMKDGVINIFDFNYFMANWIKKGRTNNADINNDGIVDLRDINFVMVYWGRRFIPSF